MSYETTKLGYADLKAGCHPADKSARAQILSKNINPNLYELLVSFSKKTKRGGLLNTSFNLHGYPIVNTYKDAIYVFKNSDLDCLILDDIIIKKKHVK